MTKRRAPLLRIDRLQDNHVQVAGDVGFFLNARTWAKRVLVGSSQSNC